MNHLLNTISAQLESRFIVNRILSEKKVALKNVYGAYRPLAAAAIRRITGRPVLMILPEHNQAELLLDEIESIDEQCNAGFFPAGQEDSDSPLIINSHRAGLQMDVLRGLLLDKINFFTASAEGLVQPVPSPEYLMPDLLELKAGLEIDLTHLAEKLIDFGYTRETMVERPGEISIRGGILDLFPFTGESPLRIEFFGNILDSIRSFNIETQRSMSAHDSIQLISSTLAWRDRAATILDYIPKNTIIWIQDPELIRGRLESLSNPNGEAGFTEERIKNIYKFIVIEDNTISTADCIDMGSRPHAYAGQTSKDIRAYLNNLTSEYSRIVLVHETDEQKRRLSGFLELDESPLPGLQHQSGFFQNGFLLKEEGFAVFTQYDLFRRSARIRVRHAFARGAPIRELSALKSGDFVVHVDHGIGRYDRLEKITVQNVETECLTISYQDGDKLFVPVDKMDRVQKYAAKDGAVPALTKLGTASWEKAKQRTKDSIKKIAGDLIKLYSKRKTVKGYAFSAKTAWENDLEASFAWDETPDQLKAIDQITADMEELRPMDRLICGDVGFGKTEVAVRAAFKAVMDQKQAAVLAPTTILAHQHYKTFSERLSAFPVNIDVLSRFRSKKEQQETLGNIRSGKTDIVIGTHRLLSKDVEFNDLGLLIIDEEQRFGVRQKEQLKKLKENVDVIALSATPIPRTLQFSMIGVRDMSVINTPPKDRIPIITQVSPFNTDLIRQAIENELSRGGQIFFVHNRVRSINIAASLLQRIVPGLRIGVAHGQMGSSELETVMRNFVDGHFQCLVSTMIIGSGVDMPHVNTLIVHRADQLGLSQLYQLRGRVGRSDRRAYAYLLTPPFRTLSREAVARLRTIEEFTELGSGFQIALKDMEIRGAGNLLGVAQSGNIETVGFELYTRLLEEAVEELKYDEFETKAKSVLEKECRVDVDVSAYIPESYVKEQDIRVSLYHRLNGFGKIDDISCFAEELRDRFGPVPQETIHLLDVSCLRLMGMNNGFKRILLKGRTLLLFFDQSWVDHFASPELFSSKLRNMIDRSPVPVRFIQDKVFGLRATLPEKADLSFARKCLESWC